MNTITPTVLAEFETAIDSVLEEGTRALLIVGRGDRAFSAGAQVQSVVDESNPVGSIEVSRTGQRVFGKLESCDVPVVAAIDGCCLGGGMELATCTDLRIASERSTFGQPEHDLGLLPGWAGPSGCNTSSARAARRRSFSPLKTTTPKPWNDTASSMKSPTPTTSLIGFSSVRSR